MPLLPLPEYVRLAGPFGVSGFALAAVAGMAAGRLLLGQLLQRRPQVLADAADSLLPGLLGALVLGRLANQLAIVDLRWSQPLTWFAASGTSVSYAGAVVGAAVAGGLALRGKSAARRWAVADALAPAAALGVAVGWLGVPALGRPTAWLHPPLYGGLGVQPVQLYGCAGFLAIAAYLWWAYGRLDFPGQNAASFLCLMSAFRFVLGFLVPGPVWLGPWTAAQVGDGLLALAGLGAAWWLARAPQAAVGGAGGGGGVA